MLSVIKNGKKLPVLCELGTGFKSFIEELTSVEYISALQEKLGIHLENCLIDVGFFRFKQGDWVSVHTDRPDKVVTQLFYFNSEWKKIGEESC